ncbi:MAG TPA: GNAT family N-acetyltransferase [Pyrinomonadaceae bacterium]|nr:GNAT family N-acetyltransferase [Pyrinomonadaceae bacterium]
MEIFQAQSSKDISAARELLEEYGSWVEISLCFQNFDHELASLPGDYAPPDGCLFLAREAGELAGCVALRSLGAGTAEMKRLFVRPAFRGRGLGRVLTEKCIEVARSLGYERLVLDTLPDKMDRAIAMYRARGFKEIEPYYHNPVEGATFMELRLA